MYSGLEVHFVANKIGGLSRVDKTHRGSAKTMIQSLGSHSRLKLIMKQPLNQGFCYRLRKGLHILTGVILSAFPSLFGMNIPKTAQE